MSSMAGCWDLYLIIEAYLRKKIQQKYDLKTHYPLWKAKQSKWSYLKNIKNKKELFSVKGGMLSWTV